MVIICFAGGMWYCFSTNNTRKDGKSSARIIVQDKMPNSKTSAQFLQRFLTEISGVALPIENDKTPRKGDILIGGQSPAEVTEDGFSISTQDGILKISGKENGVVYGVVTLLEQYLGIDYWERMNILLPLQKQ